MEDEKLPELYPGWKTIKRIGTGSFGTVYEIERNLFGRIEKAALKYIPIPHSNGDVEELYSNGYDDSSITAHFNEYLADIVREYSLMAEMKGHTNVVYCDDIRYVQHDDGFGWDIFIKMELLTPLLKTVSKVIDEKQVVRVGMDICKALVLCEGKGIIHRDIKPQNIFVSNTGDYKLGDFGVAKTMERTAGGTKIGTYSYMAPEVYNNQPYGSAADICSLGLVMYWLLNERRLPFLPLPPSTPTSAETEGARLRRFSGEMIPEPKNGSEQLKSIVLKACAYNPKERYASAQEMLDALAALHSGVPVIPEKHEEVCVDIVDEDKTVLNTEVSGFPVAAERDGGKKAYYGEKKDSNTQNNRLEIRKDAPAQPRKLAVPKKAIIGFVAFLVLLLVVLGLRNGHRSGTTDAIEGKNISTGITHEHSWKEATCTYAKRCLICGETEDTALGHQWINASASSPRMCNTCGITEGRSLGSPLSQCAIIADSNTQGSTKDVKVGDWIDCLGVTHYKSLRFWVVKKTGYTNKEYITYDLQGQYNEMDISIQLDEKSQTGATAYIRVYLDGQLAETSQVVSKESSAIIFTVSVDSINRVKIECVTDASKHAYCIVDAILFVT